MAQTDDSGNFEFRILVSAFHSDFFSVKLQYLGYHKFEILNIPLSKTSYFIDLGMQVNPTILGGMEMVVGYLETVHPLCPSTGKTFLKEDLDNLAK